jgi:dipeptidyl aminopeptidase/acylaminoacyl peptidase
VQRIGIYGGKASPPRSLRWFVVAGLAVVLGVASTARAQGEIPVNRNPVDDAMFAQIADLFQYDHNLPIESATIGAWPYRIPYVIEKITYRSVHHERVPGYFAHPLGEGGRRFPAVLLVHGSNGFWGKNEDWVLDWLDVLVRSGRAVLVIDNYGFGERMRSPDIEEERLLPYEMRDMVVQSVIDQERGIDYLETRPDVDPKKLGLLGGSRGSWIGAMAAGLDHRFAAVVLTVTQESNGSTDDPSRRYRHTLNFVPRITAPVLLVNATQDKAVRSELATEMTRLLRVPHRQVWYESGHYIAPKTGNKEVLEWFDTYLK